MAELRIVPQGTEQKCFVEIKDVAMEEPIKISSGTYWIHVSYVAPPYGRNRKQVIDNLMKR